MNEFEAQKKMMGYQFDRQAEITNKQIESQERMYAPTLNEQMAQSQAVVIHEVNPAKTVDNILLEFEGKEIDPITKETQVVSEPIMNKIGIMALKTRLKGIVQQHTIMGDYGDAEIKNLSLRITNHITEDIGINWRKYGIKNRNVADAVVDVIGINILTAFKRAKDRSEKNFYKGLVYESIGSAHGGGGKKGEETSWWQKLKL